MTRVPIGPVRFAKWFAITIACALPLLVPLFRDADPPAVLAVTLGITTWATGMTLLDTFLAQRRPAARSRALSIGFAAWAVVQGVTVLVLGREHADVWFTPYYVSALPGAMLIAGFGDTGMPFGGEPLTLYVLTVSCGLFDFVAGLLVTGLVAALTRPRRSPRRITASSPAPLSQQHSLDE